MKKALISGITGQDGSFLAEFLLQKGQIDMIVDRREMRSRISCLTQHLMRRPPVAGA